MVSLENRNRDDELLLLLLDAPSRWLVRNGLESWQTNSLRNALCKAYNCDARDYFNGFIVKQPNDEMVIAADQVRRLWKHIDVELLDAPRPRFFTRFSNAV